MSIRQTTTLVVRGLGASRVSLSVYVCPWEKELLAKLEGGLEEGAAVPHQV